jgi:hypothetical protein
MTDRHLDRLTREYDRAERAAHHWAMRSPGSPEHLAADAEVRAASQALRSCHVQYRILDLNDPIRREWWDR